MVAVLCIVDGRGELLARVYSRADRRSNAVSHQRSETDRVATQQQTLHSNSKVKFVENAEHLNVHQSFIQWGECHELLIEVQLTDTMSNSNVIVR